VISTVLWISNIIIDKIDYWSFRIDTG